MKTQRLSTSTIPSRGLLRAVSIAAILAAGSFSGLANAQSSSNVRLYGLLDMSVGRFQAPGAIAQTAAESGKMTTSYIGMAGSEDLGGGLSAVFALEQFLLADSGVGGRFVGDALYSRASYVGLSGGFGRVLLGRQATGLYTSTLLFNSFGGSFGFSPSVRHYFTSGTTTGDSGWYDGVSYTAPKFGGFTASVMAAPGEGNGGNNVSGNVIYTGGAFAATGAYQKVKKGSTVDDSTTWQLGASYTVDQLKLFAQRGRAENDTTSTVYDLTELGFSLNVGVGRVLLSYGKIDPSLGAKRNTTSVGYNYPLSKRTDTYVVAMNDKIAGLAAGKNFAIGIRHSF